MTSGTFTTVAVDLIIIPDNRQRKEFDDKELEELAESIRTIGLIQPIVITRENILVAGERRLRAHKLLQFSYIHAHYTDELSTEALEQIELEENIRRADLTWQERVEAIERFHKLHGGSIEETAEKLNMVFTTIRKSLVVSRNMKKPEVATAQNFSGAFNFAQRAEERQQASVKRDVGVELQKLIEPTSDTKEPKTKARPVAIVNESFHKWAMDPSLKNVNFLHCDFPYGINTGDKVAGQAHQIGGHYDDSEETYFDLIDELGNNNHFIAESCHLMFWLSMKHYINTVGMLETQGWRVFNPLLIWTKSDNAGIIADPNRTPRNTAEIALFASRGDRKIVRPIASTYVGATTKQFHSAEKPAAMLAHFFRMFVDESTIMLDPTCGSGMAVKVAERMGAKFSLGLEINPQFADDAKRNLEL